MKKNLSDLGRYSIRTKLLTINLMTMGAVLLIVIGALLGNGFVSGRTAMLEDLNAQASMIAANSTAAMVFNDPRAATDILSALRASPAVKEAALFNEERRFFAGYRRDSGDADIVTFPQESAKGHVFSATYLDLYLKVIHDNRQVGKLYMRADLGPLYQRLFWYGMTIILMAAAALAVGFVLISRLQRAITMPITRLADLSRQISDKRDYSIRTPVESADEIGSLAKSFNDMLAQIQVREVELKHELAERKHAEERLDHLAKYDTVTGLPNRYYFNDGLSVALAKASKAGEIVALMFLDLDNFKVVNDTLGHHVGDELLHYVAHSLQMALRPGDVICRVGGDEFAVILDNMADSSQATVVAEKCNKALSGVINFKGNDVYVSVSIGISLYPNDTTDMHELLKNADTAMYHAKAKGKNTSQIFLSEMKGIAQKRLTAETSLRRAIERNEFQLNYQPLIELPGRSLVGVEALIRWMHPDLGVVMPMDFIPLAEETGLIVPIGAWALHTACAQAKVWNDMGLKPIRMAVNLSGRQFKEDNIVEVIFAALRETGLDPQLLELELTESTLMDSDSVTIAKLNELRAAGINLSIDDFGTGYSSMTSLKSFPISTLKIDRSFIRDLPRDSDDVAITRAIIAMAQSLKISVTAEGVETEEQLELLEKIGCDLCQGNYFSRPMPALAMTAFLNNMDGKQLNRVSSGG